MAYSLIQDRLNASRHKLRPALWARRLVGLTIVVSGGALLAGDLIRMVSGSAAQPVAPALYQST